MNSPVPFVERYGLHNDHQRAAAARSHETMKQHDIEVVRLIWPDQHGLIRGKALTVDGYLAALRSGAEATIAPFFFDTANTIAINPFTPDGGIGDPELAGLANMVMVPDPETVRVLPWAPDTAWVLCDLYTRDGMPFPYSPRHILRRTLERVQQAGYRFVAGIEIEWYLTRIVDDMLATGAVGAPGRPGDPAVVAPLNRGYNLMLEGNLDVVDDALRPIRRALVDLGLPLRSVEDEWAPSQIETTFDILEGVAAADAALLARQAIKHVARRNGHLASFMCTPGIPGFYASGWHLHTSLVDATDGTNLMVPGEGELLSELGRHYVGGTLAHAAAASVFTTPTVNGYRRRRPYSLAPDRLTWGADNRAAMVRVISAANDPASHVENRVGEPAANPYLYFAAQAAAGLDGVLNKIEPGEPSVDPYAEDAESLPGSLEQALERLTGDRFYREAFGSDFVDYLLTIKQSEVQRYNAHLAEHGPDGEYAANVTEWEHREYFELF
ncbi:glutamine synthetase family protein [Nocardia sp. CA-135953]|uniref:glutamine synthetase family protein n=1 Tax=Nocardia sp. CA-135953 TaxID=3239978 RepID=UPI003D970346